MFAFWKRYRHAAAVVAQRVGVEVHVEDRLAAGGPRFAGHQEDGGEDRRPTSPKTPRDHRNRAAEPYRPSPRHTSGLAMGAVAE